MNKKNKRKLGIFLLIMVLGVGAILTQSFNLISSGNPVELQGAEKTQNYYTLEKEFQEKEYNTQWNSNSQTLLTLGGSEGVPSGAYVNDNPYTGGGITFCQAYGGTFVSNGQIDDGVRYYFNGGKWRSDGYDEDVAVTVNCKLPTGNFLVEQGTVLVKDIKINTSYESLRLDYRSQLNGGTIGVFVVFNGEEYPITSQNLPVEDFEGQNIDLKFVLTGSLTSSPKLFDDYVLTGITSDSTDEEEIVIDVQEDTPNEESESQTLTSVTNYLTEGTDEVDRSTTVLTEQQSQEAGSSMPLIFGIVVVLIIVTVIVTNRLSSKKRK